MTGPADVPASHDGSAACTLELRFSEKPHGGFSYNTRRDHACTVTNGNVAKSRRLAPPSNIGWEIYVTPDGDRTMSVPLPATIDRTAQGAIRTDDRRHLSQRLELNVPGS